MRFKNSLAFLSLLFLITIGTLALFAPQVTRHSYETQNITEKLETPSLQHWMGTDSLGRDVYSRIVYGARLSLFVGIGSALFALIVGTSVGAMAGYRGGWTDEILMRIVDLFYIFPSILTTILLTLLLGRSLTSLFLALGLTSWVTHARLVRGQVLQAKEQRYVEAARALGLSEPAILVKHILPNLWGVMLASLTIQIPTQILNESLLSFIGLGVQPPLASWGSLAHEGFQAMHSYPHLILFPGGVLFLTMLALNYLGEGLK